MKTLAVLLVILTKMQTINFGDKNTSWYALNDGVMGGLSKGEVSYKDGALIFQGNLSFKNNGGFASVRSPYDAWDLSPYESIEIKYRLKGQAFAFVLETEREFWRPTYRYTLPETEEWKVVNMPLADFEAHRLGKPSGYLLSKEDRAKLIRLGLISSEKTTEPFRLEIDYINFK